MRYKLGLQLNQVMKARSARISRRLCGTSAAYHTLAFFNGIPAPEAVLREAAFV
jgi:hypothetical protein